MSAALRSLARCLLGRLGYIRIRDTLQDATCWVAFVAIVRGVTCCTHFILSIGSNPALELEAILHTVHMLAVLTGALGFLVARVMDEIGYYRARVGSE